MNRTLFGTMAMLAFATISVVALQKNVLLKGLSSDKTVVVVVNGSEQPVGTVGANGEIAIPLDAALAAAVDPNKNYVIYQRDMCNRYEIVVQDSDDDKRCQRQDRDESGTSCGRCFPVALILKGRFQLTSGAGQPALPTASGFSVGAFGFVTGSRTNITNVEETAFPTINQRFDDAGYNPGRDIRIDEKGTGIGWGGGVNLAWGQVPVGMRVGFTHEQERTTPTQTIRGERDVNGLIFEQFGDSQLRSTTLFFGPTAHIPGGIVVTAGPAVSWWQVNLSQTGSLRALCPNPCTVVRTDDVRREADGTNVGFHVGAEFYPGTSWYGFYTSFTRVTLEDVYEPTEALALPRDWHDLNFFVGVTLRTKGGRPRTIGR